MALTDNERLQELVLVIGDKTAPVNKKWWYVLMLSIILAVPVYYLSKTGFVALALKHYQAPQLIYSDQPKQALTVKSTGIFDLGNNNYSGYMKIGNIEHDWGVESQPYTAVFKTFGGTVLTQVTGSVYILPSSEKLVVFARFKADKKPDQIDVTLGETHFIHDPGVLYNFSLQRVTILNPAEGLTVSASITNTTAFSITRVNLPVAVFDNKGEIVAVNFTYINDLKSGETRSFQYTWPRGVTGALRAEITPEIDIFDRNIFQVPTGGSSF